MTAKFFGVHPSVVGFLIVVGAAAFLYFGYGIFFEERSAEDKTMNNYDLRVAGSWAAMIIGGLMYLAGGVLYGRSREVNGFLSFLLHLCLPLLGLLLLTIIGRRLTPHQRWERDNPGLDPKTAKRTYRPMKPLY